MVATAPFCIENFPPVRLWATHDLLVEQLPAVDLKSQSVSVRQTKVQ